MELSWSLDEMARTSDDAAVRAHFDVRTLAWLRVVTIVVFIVTFGLFVHALSNFQKLPVVLSLASFVVALGMLSSIRKSAKHRLAGFIRRRVRATAMSFALFEAACVIAYHGRSEGMIAMSILFPLLIVGFRLLPAEHVLLHASFVTISAVVVALMPHPREKYIAMVAPVFFFNLMLLMVSLFVSRRARKQIVADWTERRASAREQIRMRDELAYARELQLSMLPECAPALGWADLCAISVPATEVGGDYYDYFVEGDRVALVCGDVAGHGMASGIVLSAMRSGFTLLRDSLGNPAAVLRRLHDLVAETSRRRMLVTVAVVLLDRANKTATIASAGHPPVIVARANGAMETLNLYAPPLGVRLPVEIPQVTMDISSGDVLVLHSDGVYETRNGSEETYGLERLANVIAAHRQESAETIRNAIIADVERFRGSSMVEDDVTVVVAKVA